MEDACNCAYRRSQVKQVPNALLSVFTDYGLNIQQNKKTSHKILPDNISSGTVGTVTLVGEVVVGGTVVVDNVVNKINEVTLNYTFMYKCYTLLLHENETYLLVLQQ